jgi:3-oxoacyl-[acyl-carrier protein] reductase
VLVLLTGGSGGIGSSIKTFLVESGHTVVAPISTELDLSDSRAVSNWLSNNSQIEFDVIVFCAGINNPKNLIEVEEEEYLRILQVNTNACREIFRTYIPGMKERKFGRLIAISSSYSTIAREGRSSYSMSKAALEALVRSAAIENAGLNVLANIVVPGFVETPLTSKNNSPSQIQKIIERIPVKRLGKPEEIAALVYYLVSESNSYITGQSIHIDGGFSIN